MQDSSVIYTTHEAMYQIHFAALHCMVHACNYYCNGVIFFASLAQLVRNAKAKESRHSWFQTPSSEPKVEVTQQKRTNSKSGARKPWQWTFWRKIKRSKSNNSRKMPHYSTWIQTGAIWGVHESTHSSLWSVFSGPMLQIECDTLWRNWLTANSAFHR